MKMNAELRHKQNVLQAQMKSTVERKADMEADLKEKNKVIEKLQAQLDRTNSNCPVCTPHDIYITPNYVDNTSFLYFMCRDYTIVCLHTYIHLHTGLEISVKLALSSKHN